MSGRISSYPNAYNAEFNDPRLVDVYDAESPWRRDDDYFLALAHETPGARVSMSAAALAGSRLDSLRLGTSSQASIHLQQPSPPREPKPEPKG